MQMHAKRGRRGLRRRPSDGPSALIFFFFSVLFSFSSSDKKNVTISKLCFSRDHEVFLSTFGSITWSFEAAPSSILFV